MGTPTRRRAAAERAGAPEARLVRAGLLDYMRLTGSTVLNIAREVGYSRATVDMFIHSVYRRGFRDDLFLRTAIWEFVQSRTTTPAPGPRGRLFETAGYRQIRRYVLRAIEHGEIALIYGPPGVQKTFVIEHLVAERQREEKNDAIYVYAAPGLSMLSLLKRVCRAAGGALPWESREQVTSALVYRFASCGKPPAVLVDEAQHLSIDCLEILRELHDRAGCGLVLIGSHSLFESFVRPERRPHLEQWLSRIDHRQQLPGLLKDEVCEIAARELGNGQPAQLTEKQRAVLLTSCRVQDVYARGPDGRPAVRTYYSARRLVKVVADLAGQLKAHGS
jgi:DNA transposition AAA+ family ATPase